jgi:tetraacyldisaccharide 4'-kinase
MYSKGWLKTHTADAMVFSIGNITSGGTGKTPLVIWLCNLLRQKGHNVAILTRGYKSKKGKHYDEPAILAKSCPGVNVIVNPDRVAGAAEATNKYGAEVLVMDDGFQHRRLARNLDILTIDATCPLGYGRVLPAGFLREPVAGLTRADAMVLTRCNQIEEAELARLEQELRLTKTDMLIARSIHTPICARSVEQKLLPLEQLKDKRVFAFCGIGNPKAFLNTVEELGCNLVGSRIYNDHHHYVDADMADIYEESRYLRADLILTTQKDWTKTALPGPTERDILFAYLVIDLQFLAGEDKLKALIEDALAGKIVKKSES